MSKGTTRRSVRVSDELWEAATAKAESEGVTLSSVVREALEQYLTKENK